LTERQYADTMRGMDSKDDRNAEITRLYVAGHMMQDIADHYAISKARVQQILAKLGIRGADGGLARRMAERAKRRSGK